MSKVDCREGAKMIYTNPKGWSTFWTFENDKWVGRTDDGREVGTPIETVLGI